MSNTTAEVVLAVFNFYNRFNVWYRKYELDLMPIIDTDVTFLVHITSLLFNVNLYKMRLNSEKMDNYTHIVSVVGISFL